MASLIEQRSEKIVPGRHRNGAASSLDASAAALWAGVTLAKSRQALRPA
jgi:hypothetical protein